jgi:orotidine-5'-phosphate decarboxylase
MLEAAAEAAARQPTPPMLIAVTVLTSMDSCDYAELGYADTLEDRVTRLASLSHDCGLGGVVCSAREARALRACCGPEFALVTPGIRPPGSAPGDQSRVVTPVDAVANGANYLVIGRPITQASNPQEALRSINDSLL